MRLSPELEPGHCPPPTPPPAPPRRQVRHHLKPAAAFRIPASRVKLRRPRAATIGHLHTNKTIPRADRDRDCPALSSGPAVPDTIAEKLAHQQGSVILARMPGTEHLPHERAGYSPTLWPPGKRHALPYHRPGHQRTRPSGPHHPPGKPPGRRADTQGCTLDSAAHVKPEHATGAARPKPSAESPSRLDLVELTAATDAWTARRRPAGTRRYCPALPPELSIVPREPSGRQGQVRSPPTGKDSNAAVMLLLLRSCRNRRTPSGVLRSWRGELGGNDRSATGGSGSCGHAGYGPLGLVRRQGAANCPAGLSRGLWCGRTDEPGTVWASSPSSPSPALAQGFCRRITATSWRSTSSSASLRRRRTCGSEEAVMASR